MVVATRTVCWAAAAGELEPELQIPRAAQSYAPPGSGGTATMEGIGGGGNGAPEEGYSMVAYARQFVSDIAALVAAAPAPVQYALILLVCYLFWKIFA